MDIPTMLRIMTSQLTATLDNIYSRHLPPIILFDINSMQTFLSQVMIQPDFLTSKFSVLEHLKTGEGDEPDRT